MEGIASIASAPVNPRNAATAYNAASSGFSVKKAISAPAPPPPPVALSTVPSTNKDVIDKEKAARTGPAVASATMPQSAPNIAQFEAAATAYKSANAEEEDETPSPTPSPSVTEAASAAPAATAMAASASAYNTVASASSSTVCGVGVSIQA